ncbi:hypothetical protein [Brachyspira sp. G79]|nr:hypothetical protein [Brachyspira sp. G79]
MNIYDNAAVINNLSKVDSYIFSDTVFDTSTGITIDYFSNLA